MPRRGEVWWLEEPDIGRRPVLVMTRDAALPVLTWALVAPVTRTVRGIPTEVPLDDGDGLPEPCAATLDNLRPVRQSLLVDRVSQLSEQKMDAACAALRVAVDCGG